MENMTEYQKNLVRMWDSLRNEYKGVPTCITVSCGVCPLQDCCCGDNGNISFNSEKAIEIVTQWAKDHPILTYEQKYEETFGVKPLQIDKCTKNYLCPKHAGFDIGINCNAQSCEKCKEEFWKSEYKEPKRG